GQRSVGKPFICSPAFPSFPFGRCPQLRHGQRRVRAATAGERPTPAPRRLRLGTSYSCATPERGARSTHVRQEFRPQVSREQLPSLPRSSLETRGHETPLRPTAGGPGTRGSARVPGREAELRGGTFPRRTLGTRGKAMLA